jgi:hypothetical protein
MRRPTIGLAYSTCRLCRHGAESGLELVCTRPAAVGFAGPEPVALQRAPGADCGPNATHMQAAYRGHPEAP